MRPVDRGAWPQLNGVNVEFSDYRDARRFLYERLGEYCSYCNRRLETAAVEHVRPKNPGGIHHPDREKDWNNFLLGCVNCNSYKGDQDVVPVDYFWPDTDNTMRAVEYHDSGSVSVPARLVGTPEEAIAKRTIALTGLNHVPKLDPAGNVPTTATDPNATDLRFERRRKVWLNAIDARQDLLDDPSDRMIRRVIQNVIDAGYWPIWYKHLADLPKMRDALIACAPNTVGGCFEPNGNLMPRAGGKL